MHIFCVGSSADFNPNAPHPSLAGHTLDHEGLFYDISPRFWQICGAASLFRPQILFAENKEDAHRMGQQLIEQHFAPMFGWERHSAVTTDISDAALAFVRARREQRKRKLRFFVIDGLMAVQSMRKTRRLTFSEWTVGENSQEAIDWFRENRIDQICPPVERIGYVAKLRQASTEHLFRWADGEPRNVVRLAA